MKRLISEDEEPTALVSGGQQELQTNTTRKMGTSLIT